MTEELRRVKLRKMLSDILVNAHYAFRLIPLDTNKAERHKIGQIMAHVIGVGNTLQLEVNREMDVIINQEIQAAIQKINEEDEKI